MFTGDSNLSTLAVHTVNTDHEVDWPSDILEAPAGGFMNSAEAQSVRDKTGDVQQIE